MNSGSGNRDESTRTADRETASSNTDQSTGQPDRRSGTGESIGRAFDSAGETLAQPGPKSQLTFVIGLFAVIGIGFGLTGIVVIRLIAGSGEGIGAQILTAVFLVSLLVVLLLSGSIIGAVSGLRIADRLDETARTVYLTSFVGTAVGYFVMVIVAAVLIGLVVGGGGDGAAASSGSGNLFGILDLVIPLVVLAIPVGLTGVGASFLSRRPTIREPPAR